MRECRMRGLGSVGSPLSHKPTFPHPLNPHCLAPSSHTPSFPHPLNPNCLAPSSHKPTFPHPLKAVWVEGGRKVGLWGEGARQCGLREGVWGSGMRGLGSVG